MAKRKPGEDKRPPICGYRRLNGETCERPVQPGGTRCHHHGRTQAQRLRRKALQEAAEEEEARALDDPDLLDLRRMVARAEAVIRRTNLLATEEMAERLARRRILKDIGDDLVGRWLTQLERMQTKTDEPDRVSFAEAVYEALDVMTCPTEGDLDLATLEIHERTAKLVAVAARTQTEATRALDWSATSRELILPHIEELSLRIASWARKWVGRHAPADVAPSIDELAVIMRRTIGELAELRERA